MTEQLESFSVSIEVSNVPESVDITEGWVSPTVIIPTSVWIESGSLLRRVVVAPNGPNLVLED